MALQTAPPRRQRIAVLTTVFALHVLLLALLLRQADRALAPAKRSSIAMISIEATRPAAAKPPPPMLPAKLAKTFKPITEVSIPADAESTAPAGASAACSTIGAVLDGLLLDPVTVAAVRNAPPETRSIAGAVMMWNEAWIPAALEPSTPLWPVRANIEHTLAAVSDTCLDEAIIGPRLMPMPDASGTGNMFVVVGSGTWTWRQMVTQPATLAPEGDALVPEPTAQRQ